MRRCEKEQEVTALKSPSAQSVGLWKAVERSRYILYIISFIYTRFAAENPRRPEKEVGGAEFDA